MNRLEQAYKDSLKSKFGLTKLETEHVDKPSQLINVPKPTPQQHWKTLMQDYREKYGISALQMEDGPLARRLEQHQTLADATIDADRSRAVNMKLATGSTTYQGKPLRLWYEVSK